MRLLSHIRSRALRILLVVLTVLIVLMGIVAGGAQFLAGYLLRDALIRAGNDNVAYENVSLNVFTGTVGVEGLYVGRGLDRVLDADRVWFNLSMTDLLRGRVYGQSLELEGAYLRIDDADGLRVAGIDVAGGDTGEAEAGAPTAIPVFGLDRLLLVDSRISLYLGEHDPLTVQLDSIELQHFMFDADAPPSPMSLVAHVGGGRIELTGTVSADARRQQIEASLLVTDLDLQEFARFGGAGITSLAGVVDLDYRLQFSRATDAPLQVGGQLDLKVRDVAYAEGDILVALDSVRWQGQQALTLSDGDSDLQTQGRVDLVAPRVSLPRYQVRAESLSWDGSLAGGLDETGVHGEQKGTAEIAKVEASLSSGVLAIEGVTADGRAQLGSDEPLVVNGLVLSGVTYDDRQAERRLLRIGSSEVRAMSLDLAQRSVQIEAIVVDALDATLNITKNGEVRGVRSLVAALVPPDNSVPADQSSGPQAQQETAPWRTRIGSIELAGASDFRFEDDSVAPPVTVLMRELSGRVGTMDSAAPAAATPVELAGRVDEYGRVSLGGDIKPFAERPTASLQGGVEAIDLARFSPYMQLATGYAIRSGQLNAKVGLDLDQGQLDGEIDFRLRSPDFEPVDPEQVERFTQRVSMPLELVVATLVDKNGDLSLEVPIAGDVTDPQFSAQDVFRLAASKAMQAAAVNYLKNTLQPYGTLITVLGLAGKAAGYVALEPVLFEPGQVALTEAGTDYLDKVAQLMRDRGGLRIKLCGMAVPADREPLGLPAEGELAAEQAQRLEGLARERALAIKEYLIAQDGVKVDHLFICTPEVSAKPDAVPRVKLEL